MRSERLTFLITFAFVAVVYALTSAPGLGLVDSGELTTAAATLGIAHPTGYPLYVLLGHVWLLLLPLAPDRAMVLFSAVAGALTAGILSVLALRILHRAQQIAASARALMAVLLAVGFSLTPSAWNAVSFAEVYPLTALLGALILFFTFADSDRASVSRAPFFISFLWGLAFGNHLTILWFAPLVFYVIGRYIRRAAQPRQALLLCLGLFFLGTSINLYLPLRSSVSPLLDWDSPRHIDGLIRHLRAWQYHEWMFEGGFGGLFRKFGRYLWAIPADIGWGLTLLTAAGLLTLFRVRDWRLRTVFIVWLIGILYNLNYDIPDISTYFYAFYAPLFLIATAGLTEFVARSPATRWNVRRQWVAAGMMCLLVPLASFARARSSADQSNNRFAGSLAREVLRTLPDSALVFQANWDLQSPIIYLQTVERVRPDVVMLDISLTQHPWYLQQELRRHPEIFAGCDAEIAAFIRLVKPFEAGQAFDARRIESAFVAMYDAIIARQLPRRPVYLRDAKLTGHQGIGKEFPQQPGAYFVRLTTAPTTEPAIDATRIQLPPRDPDPARTRYILGQLAIAAAAQGYDALQRGDRTLVAATVNTIRFCANPDPGLAEFVKQAEDFLKSNTEERE